MECLEHSWIGSSSAQAVQVDELADRVDQLGLSHPELDFVSLDVLKSLSLRHAPPHPPSFRWKRPMCTL